jgi:septum formation protein
MSPAQPVLLLASASPRRRELLLQLGVAHSARAAHLDERQAPAETARGYVERIACAKASALRHTESSLPVLGADTVVGRVHEVLTAVALADSRGVSLAVNVSTVRFRALTDAECRDYWQSGEPRDKAGGYAIQGFAAAFIESLHGSYSGVMGLPLFETAALLRAAGVPYGRRVSA